MKFSAFGQAKHTKKAGEIICFCTYDRFDRKDTDISQFAFNTKHKAIVYTKLVRL